MKKILLLVIVTIATNSFADNEREGFYLKGGFGANKIANVKETSLLKTISDNPSIISKPIFSNYNYNLGFGYYINSALRSNLEFDYLKVDFDNAKKDISYFSEDNENIHLKTNLSRKTDIVSVMLNSYLDFVITDKDQFFLGGGRYSVYKRDWEY